MFVAYKFCVSFEYGPPEKNSSYVPTYTDNNNITVVWSEINADILILLCLFDTEIWVQENVTNYSKQQ